MDRRQLLFGASALGLVTNLNRNHPLIAQVGSAVMSSRRLSDRERAGLRGPVKTCSDFMEKDADSPRVRMQRNNVPVRGSRKELSPEALARTSSTS